MVPSSSSFVTAESSFPILSFSSSSFSNAFLRASGTEERSTILSTLSSSSLFTSSANVSPSSFLPRPGDSPSVFLNSPMPLAYSNNILASHAAGSAFPTQAIDWRGKDTNYQQEFKEDSKPCSKFSFQTSTRPATLQSSSFHPSSIGLMASVEEAFNMNQHSWSNQQPSQQSSNEIPINSQVSSKAEHISNYSNISAQSLRQQRRLDDGYNWRKYGQKQVKGSENPRSYYKCTNSSCPTTKKVERTSDGHITEIIYKGTHNHPKPQRTRKNSFSFQGLQGSIHHEGKAHSFNGRLGGSTDSITVENFSASYAYGNDDIDMSSQRIRTAGDDYDEGVPYAKKWRMEDEDEDEGIENSVDRTVREPKVVVQTTSDIDVLDDGYRWRKYGQKVVKGNPNPRSYYKCTSSGCQVRKHIERASTDLRDVITTYEGKHNHDVPAPRGSGRLNTTLFDNNSGRSFSINNNSYSMSNNSMAIWPSSVSESHPGQVASDSIFSTSPHGLETMSFSSYEIQ